MYFSNIYCFLSLFKLCLGVPCLKLHRNENEEDLGIFFTTNQSSVVPMVNRGNTTPEPDDLDEDEDISPIAPNCVREKRML
jgi:hypothetical protein